MNPTDDLVDQANPIPTIIALTRKGRNDLNKTIAKAARFTGNTQYPRTQTD